MVAGPHSASEELAPQSRSDRDSEPHPAEPHPILAAAPRASEAHRPRPRPRPRAALAIAASVAALLCAKAPCEAIVFHLRSGERIEGAIIGEAGGRITYLDAEGAKRELDRADVTWIDPRHRLRDGLERKAKGLRKRFLRARRRAARKIVDALARAKPEDFSRIASQLDDFQPAEVLPALDRALGSRSRAVREHALRRLAQLPSRGALVPLVKASLGHPDTDLAARCESAALAKDRGTTRQLYEYVALAGQIPARLSALDRLGRIGDPRAAPRVISLVTYVQADIRAQLVRLKEMREVPVSLGQAATQVPIQLPQVELIEVMTSTKVPVEALRRLEAAGVAALEKMSGERYGGDLAAWRSWWKKTAATLPAEPPARPGR